MNTATTDLASAEECAKRAARMEQAARERRTRYLDIAQARYLIRKSHIRTPDELLAVLNTVLAAIERPHDSWFKDTYSALLEAATDLDAELNTPPVAQDLRSYS